MLDKLEFIGTGYVFYEISIYWITRFQPLLLGTSTPSSVFANRTKFWVYCTSPSVLLLLFDALMKVRFMSQLYAITSAEAFNHSPVVPRSRVHLHIVDNSSPERTWRAPLESPVALLRSQLETVLIYLKIWRLKRAKDSPRSDFGIWMSGEHPDGFRNELCVNLLMQSAISYWSLHIETNQNSKNWDHTVSRFAVSVHSQW